MKIESCSPSRINTADSCDWKYYLTYELGIGDKLTTCPFSSNYGTTVHNVLEQYALSGGKLDWKKALLEEVNKNGLRPYDIMDTASKRVRASYFIDKDCYNCPFFNKSKKTCGIVNRHIDEFEGCPKKLHKEALNMIKDTIERYDEYFKSGIKSEDNPNGKILGVEYEFKITLGKDNWGDDILMHGLIDLVVEEDPETVRIIDYKTGYKTQTMDELFVDMQARMYSAAAKKSFPDYKFVLLTFDYFRGIPTDVVFTEEDDDKTMEVVKKKWNQIKNKTKIKRRPKDWYCQYLCNRSICDEIWDQTKKKQKAKNDDIK